MYERKKEGFFGSNLNKDKFQCLLKYSSYQAEKQPEIFNIFTSLGERKETSNFLQTLYLLKKHQSFRSTCTEPVGCPIPRYSLDDQLLLALLLVRKGFSEVSVLLSLHLHPLCPMVIIFGICD
jgi:hypothetical protein